jgi:hypothetical protein
MLSSVLIDYGIFAKYIVAIKDRNPKTNEVIPGDQLGNVYPSIKAARAACSIFRRERARKNFQNFSIAIFRNGKLIDG